MSKTQGYVVRCWVFVPLRELRFELGRVLGQAVLEWARGRALPEGYEDAVVEEMGRWGLRWLDETGIEVLFNRFASEQDYRECVFAALQRFADEAARPRTTDELEAYCRPCGE